MVRPKGCPKRYLYRGQINYLKIAKETDWIRENKLEEITKKTIAKKAGNKIVKPAKKIERRQDFIDTYGEIETALNLLTKQERLVITYLNGLDGNQPLTRQEVAEKMYFTPTWISNINQKAKEKLEPLKQKICSQKSEQTS